MLKRYLVDGREYQYEEGDQPEGAVELKETKAVEASNKAAQSRKKKVAAK